MNADSSTTWHAGGIERLLLLGQGSYFFVTGIWPIVHMPSFLYVTGPKTDLWLVQTVGSLIAVVGIVLLSAWYGRRSSPECRLLAVLSAVALMLVDIIFSLNGTISMIYLLDAVAEGVLVTAWLLVSVPKTGNVTEGVAVSSV